MEAVEPFAIDVEDRADRTVVVPRGELDMASAPELEEAVLPRLEDGAWIVLDLRSLDFIDSSGLRVVLEAERRARGEGGRLLVVPGDRVRRVFDLSGVGQLVELGDAPPEAA